jgi:hypothetical protein
MTQFHEVNGPDLEEVLNFAPIRGELVQLVKFWTTIAIDDQYLVYLHDQTGGSELLRMGLAGRRIDRIVAVLGEETVQTAMREAEEEFCRTVSPQAWAFQHELWHPLDDRSNSQNSKDSESGEQEGVDGQ